MTDEEQLATIKYTVDVVNHRVPVIAGAGSNDTDHGCALAAKSAECCADALLMALIYISTTPWFDLTSCTNERDFDKDDAIPRITWGKYVPENGRETLGMSLEVSHRFIDGYHLGQFYQTLQKSIDEL